MKLRTVVRDCLFLNWAIPLAELPAPPEPLRYQVLSCRGGEFVFASALLFRQEGIHLARLPILRFSHPQFNLRICVLDEDAVPSVLFTSILVPVWVVVGARWIAHQPAGVARFSFPSPSRDPDAEKWRWSVARQAGLALSACRGAPTVGDGEDRPGFGSWQSNVDYIRQRPRGYVLAAQGLRRIETSHPAAEVWPLRAWIQDTGLLSSSLPLASSGPWPQLHSSWLCPEIPLVFELAVEPRIRLGQVPQPVRQ